MSDKFLGVGSSSLNLGNGTSQIYAASLGAANLDASKPVRTNSVRQLVSTYLPISDIIGLQTRLNNTLTNPFNGDLNVQNLTTGITPGVQVDLNTFISNTASAIITLEDKTENVTSVSQGPDVTTYAGAVRADSIVTADIYDAATQTQIMQLSGTEINFAVSDLTLNGVQIATTADIPVIPSIVDETQGVAPAGLRDSWQIPPGLAFDGAFVQHFPGPDILYAAGGFGATLQYSLDGGITFAPVVFDVPYPTAYAPIVGYNGTNLYAISPQFGNGTERPYTSTDGINFTAGPSPTGLVFNSWQMLWIARLGLWISSINLDATHGIATSPDGLTWTTRVTPVDFTGDFNGNTIIDSGDLLVLVGTGSVWSTNGITWTAGTGISSYQQAACYSSDRKEYIASGGSTNELFRSTDGKAWVSLGLKGQYAVVSMIWVGGDIQRYYLNHPYDPPYGGTTGTTYSLFSTPDPTKAAFESTLIVGADTSGMAYSAVIYDASRKRFVVGLQTVGVAYSTDRPTVLKPMNSRKAFVSKITSQLLTGVQTNANLFVGLSPNSMLTIPANSLTIGDKYRLQFNAIVNAATNGNTATFNLSSTPAGAITNWPLTAPAGGLSNASIIARVDITVVSSGLINTQTTIGRFVGTTTLAGYNVYAANVAFDSLVNQVLAFTYTTANFTNMTLTDVTFFCVCSATD